VAAKEETSIAAGIPIFHVKKAVFAKSLRAKPSEPASWLNARSAVIARPLGQTAIPLVVAMPARP
jgi:hypothetical protein